MKNVPNGFECVATGASVFVGKGQVVVCGAPFQEEDAHNCDEMGCGWDHVLYRVNLSDESELAYARAFLTPIAGPWERGGVRRALPCQEYAALVYPNGEWFVFSAPHVTTNFSLACGYGKAPTYEQARDAADAALRASGWFLRDE